MRCEQGVEGLRKLILAKRPSLLDVKVRDVLEKGAK
jgi:hypothetical protein